MIADHQSDAAALDVLIPLCAAKDAARCGHKAAALAELSELGFDVPDGFVIPVGTMPSLAELERALARLGKVALAVRSSGCAEDLPEASYAGHYTSILDVRGSEAVLAAARQVIASASVRGTGTPDNAAPMAVLVQTLIAPDAAGVAFSANPLTGARDEVRISATRGLADRLLAGEIDGDEWCVKAANATPLTQPQAAITCETAARIAAVARAVETARNTPQDVEWALAGERLVLVQARPITVLPVAPAIEIPKGTWQKDAAHFPDPITPYGASTNLQDDGASDDMIEEWGLLPDAVRSRVIGHEFYVHMEPDDGGAKPPPGWVLGLVARILPSLRRKLRRSRQAIESGLLETLPREWESEIKPALLKRIRIFRELDLTALGDAALSEHLDELRRFSSEGMRLHFKLFVPNLVGMHELAQTCAQLLEWQPHQMFLLLQGLSTASSAPTRDLAQVAAFARDRPKARAAIEACGPNVLAELERADPEVSARLQTYLDTWGVRTFGSDAGTPNVDEKPELLARLLGDLIERDTTSSLLADRERAVTEARAALPDLDARQRFDQALAYAEVVYPLREDNVLVTDQLPTGLLRRAGIEFGRRLTQRGLLANKTDAAMLTADELTEALLARPTASIRDLVQRRKCEQAWVRANPGPAVYGPASGPPPDLSGLPAASRRINGAMLWEFEQEFMVRAPAEEGALAGIAASPGAYRGKVRVIRSTAELGKLRAGEILVCPTTSSAWMIVFHRAGALITEGGSALSHTAIVAREHALPAVVGVSRATSLLETGDEVIVDGNHGTVMRVSASGVMAQPRSAC